MAFENTEERYKYIYGNNARKLEKYTYNMEEASPAVKRPVTRRKPSAAATRWIDNIDRRFMVMSVAAIVMVVIVSFFYVHETTKVTAMAKEVRSLTETKEELQAKQSSIKSELDKSINLDDIREYAEKNLNMVSPDYDDYIYYNQDSGDYFRQYESVDK